MLFVNKPDEQRSFPPQDRPQVKDLGIGIEVNSNTVTSKKAKEARAKTSCLKPLGYFNNPATSFDRAINTTALELCDPFRASLK